MKIVYIDMDGVLVDFQSAFPKLPKEILDEYKECPDEIPNIFSLMDPMEGSIDAFQSLSKKYDVFILGTAPWENPTAWSDKLNWVKKHLGNYAFKKLILSHHKNLNVGDYLIDDRIANGVDKFQGEHIYFNTDLYPNWEAVCRYLL